METVRTSVKNFPVLISDIRSTKITNALTGAKDYETLAKMQKEGKLFKDATNDQLYKMITEVMHKGKLNLVKAQEIANKTVAEKKQYLIDNLSLTLELIQERETQRTASTQGKAFSLFMATRANVGNNESLKYAFQTATLGVVNANEHAIGQNISEFYGKSSIFLYIYRMRSFDPLLNDEGQIDSRPLRAGKGGDILRLNNRLIFMNTQLIVEPNFTEAQRAAVYTELYTEETQNELQYTPDKEQSIDAASVPMESRDKETGKFNAEFQEWLNATYADSVGAHVVAQAGVSV